MSIDPDIPKIPSKNLFPVVGIGASAGGLEAFRKFVNAIPESSGIAFIFVQHLHPEYNSSLSDIIRKDTRLPVVEIRDNIHVAPDHVYIIPPNKLLIATDGVLKLGPRPKSRKNNAIDVFFSSIAEVHGRFSIGVLLSGKGSDGTKGMQEIKQQGGVTFVQEVSSAAFPDMPQHAIDAGAGDFILAPEKIPSELIKLKQAKSLTPEHVEVEGQIDEYYFEQIYALLLIRKDVDFTYYKQTTVRRRILRRMAILKQEKISGYLEYLKQNKAEQDLLFQDMLIPVTEFFRDPVTFNILCESVYPDLLQGKSLGNPLRIWVAGCSTGQEVYSLAIALQECLNEDLSHVRVQIFATDISEKAIAKARSGIYLKKELKGVSEARLQRFFNNNKDGTFQIRKQVRDMCIFANHNFLKNPPFAKLDLISCRNVLIYMNVFLQKKAFNIFHYALNEKGILLLGKSETNINAPELFLVFDKKNKIYICKEAPDRFINMVSKHSETYFKHKNEPAHKMGHKINDFQKEADKILLDQYAPPAIIVNDHFDIVQFLGSSGAYLQPSPGKASLNVLKMVRDSYSFELRNALHTAKITREPFIREDISVDNGKRLVTIEVIPLVNTIEPYFLILFKERALLINSEGRANGVKGNVKDDRIRRLEKELARLREDIRNITEDQEMVNEELQSANEELLSDSEELQSLNEELETSTEELQSTNEELMSVNQELFERNNQLNKSRQFAETIVATLHEPLVILDKDCRIKSVNDSFFRIFRLKEEECLGTLLFELQSNAWDIPDLRRAIAAARKEPDAIIESEFSHIFPVIGKRAICFHIQQIKTEKGATSFVLALDDVTERKTVEKAEAVLKERQTFRNFFMQSHAAFCILKGPDHIFEFANAAFCRLIGDRDPTSRKMREALPELEAAGLYKILYHVYHTGKPYLGKEIPVSFDQGNGIQKEFILNFNFQAFTDVNDEVEGILAFVYDVTEQTQAQNVIRESEARYRSLISGLPIAVYTCDAAGYIRLYNTAAAELWGREPEIGKDRWCGSWKIFNIDGSPVEPDKCPMAITIKNGRTVNTEIIVQRPDGSKRHVIPYPQAEYDGRGNITGGINTLIDITDQVVTMKAIEASELKFREMANNVSSFIWVSDTHGQRNFFNRSWEKFTGRSIEQDKGMGWTEDVHKDDLEMLLKLYSEGILKRKAFEIEYRLRRADGKYRWTLCRANPVYGAEGDFSGFLGTCNDIHDQKLKEQKKDEFIGIASHEMKTPLTTAKAYLQLLEQSPLPDESGNIYAKKARQSIDRLHALITELLDVSKIQHGKLPYTMVSFDFNELISETIGDMQCSLLQHRIIRSGHVKRQISGDRNRLQQVLINLLSNAAKYSPNADEIWVEVQEKEGSIQVSVTDKGIGLNKNHLENVFDRYFRVEEHAIQFQGLGVGLFISKEIIQRHGGKIWAESEPGKGSTFSFSLPV